MGEDAKRIVLQKRKGFARRMRSAPGGDKYIGAEVKEATRNRIACSLMKTKNKIYIPLQ